MTPEWLQSMQTENEVVGQMGGWIRLERQLTIQWSADRFRPEPIALVRE
jgi:hypothetical protein